jgi:hypothetical protein
MSAKFLTPIRLISLSSNPAAGSEGELYYNSTDENLKIHNGTDWSSITSSGSSSSSSTVDFGFAYTTDAQNGKLFYNIQTGRLAIYYNSAWRELAFFDEVASIVGGSSSTDFTESGHGEMDGGDSSTTTFINVYDGGNSDLSDTYVSGESLSAGSSSTENFSLSVQGGNAGTNVFEVEVDGGTS